MFQLPGGVWWPELGQVPHPTGPLRHLLQMPHLSHGFQICPEHPGSRDRSTSNGHWRTDNVLHTGPYTHTGSQSWTSLCFPLQLTKTCLWLFYRLIYKCVMCDTVFTQKTLLHIHFETHLINQKVHVFKCPECTKLFSQRNSLLEHVKVKIQHVNIIEFYWLCLRLNSNKLS